MTDNTGNYPSRCLVEILEKSGVKDVVACPGSRNSPLLIALSRSKTIKTTMVIDERSAGFIALGIASISMRPVGIVCTSGTAVLNFSPAVAEAYYRKVPLIVISADRPMEWIDQDDSQTLRQPGVLQNFVKKSYDIPGFETPDMRWFSNRTINDAMLTAAAAPAGPVHINIQISEPLGLFVTPDPQEERIVAMVTPREDLTVSEARILGDYLASPKKVMVVAGFMAPDSTLNKALRKLSMLPNVIVLTETISNLHGEDFVSDIDATLSAIPDDRKAEFAPEVVITLGGALVSRFVKQYLRDIRPLEHWQVGKSLTTVDCFRCLTKRVEMQPGLFIQQLASAMQPHRSECDYRKKWIVARDAARSLHRSYVAKAPWSDLKAFDTFMHLIPRNYNIQLSNGTPIRYAQLFHNREFHRCDCNRGVSGIDGSTSTAIGSSMVYKSAPTLLVTGDMSAQYDLGALASRCLTPRFKMIVMCNDGGGIFHFIEATRHLDIVGKCFDEPCNFPARGVAEAFGLRYFEAKNEAALRSAFSQFVSEKDLPAMLAIRTSADISAEVLIGFFSEKLKQ